MLSQHQMAILDITLYILGLAVLYTLMRARQSKLYNIMSGQDEQEFWQSHASFQIAHKICLGAVAMAALLLLVQGLLVVAWATRGDRALLCFELFVSFLAVIWIARVDTFYRQYHELVLKDVSLTFRRWLRRTELDSE